MSSPEMAGPGVPGDDHETVLAFLLARAGIRLSAEQFSAVAAEWKTFRSHVDLVNHQFDAAEEPAFVIDQRR